MFNRVKARLEAPGFGLTVFISDGRLWERDVLREELRFLKALLRRPRDMGWVDHEDHERLKHFLGQQHLDHLN